MPSQRTKPALSPEKKEIPSLVFSDKRGKILDYPGLKMAGQSGNRLYLPDPDELVPLPFGSTLFYMPGRIPVGWDMKENKFKHLSGHSEGFAVSAFLPPGYVRTLLPATRLAKTPPILPLWAYTSVGWKDNRFWATGIMVDPDPHWDPIHFQDDEGLASLVRKAIAKMPNNRLIRHLGRCALEYHCFAAKNCFYRRWELPLPTSPLCNAECIGCLSLQPAELCPAPHGRIGFIPSVDEICEITLPHLRWAEDPIASFGQGCEGEPILQARTINKVIERLRADTKRGIINLNTNGSKPDAIAMLCRSGLDSLRVSINSPDTMIFNKYHRPKGFTLEDIERSLILAKSEGALTAINLLVFPGITDTEAERDRIIKFIKRTGIDLIQMRNLNIDPDLYIREVGMDCKRYNLKKWMSDLSAEYPNLSFGYFNRFKKLSI